MACHALFEHFVTIGSPSRVARWQARGLVLGSVGHQVLLRLQGPAFYAIVLIVLYLLGANRLTLAFAAALAWLEALEIGNEDVFLQLVDEVLGADLVCRNDLVGLDLEAHGAPVVHWVPELSLDDNLSAVTSRNGIREFEQLGTGDLLAIGALC